MREETKKRIHASFKQVLVLLAEKENNLLSIRKIEEGMPNTTAEALTEQLKGHRDYKASVRTNERLTSWAQLRTDINTFHENVLDEMPRIPIDEEGTYLQRMTDYCANATNQINNI
jgi:hypothetical protein